MAGKEHVNPPLLDPHDPGVVEVIPDTITSVPGFGKAADFRTEDDKELDKIKAEYEAEKLRIRKAKRDEERKDDEARVEKLLAGKSRVFSTVIATRASTALLTWSGVRSAMESLGVKVHPVNGSYTTSMPDPSRVGENVTVTSALSTNRMQSQRLIDVIDKAFGVTVASEKQPGCGVPKCVRKGEFPSGSHPVQLICPKHAGKKGYDA